MIPVRLNHSSKATATRDGAYRCPLFHLHAPPGVRPGDALGSTPEQARLMAREICDRWNQHESMVYALQALRRCPGVHTTDQQTGETFGTLIARALEGRSL